VIRGKIVRDFLLFLSLCAWPPVTVASLPACLHSPKTKNEATAIEAGRPGPTKTTTIARCARGERCDDGPVQQLPVRHDFANRLPAVLELESDGRHQEDASPATLEAGHNRGGCQPLVGAAARARGPTGAPRPWERSPVGRPCSRARQSQLNRPLLGRAVRRKSIGAPRQVAGARNRVRMSPAPRPPRPRRLLDTTRQARLSRML